MKKPYVAPVLVRYGRLEELTEGLLGSAPDVVGINNNDCVTGVIGTVVISCASLPVGSQT